MARLTWSPNATAQLRELRQTIAADSPSAATRLVERLRARARQAASFPQMGRVVPEYGEVAVRELIEAPYRIIYRYDAEHDRVQVIAVVHGRRVLPPLVEEH